MNSKGLSTIVIVVIISIISLLMATTASFLALGDLEISSDYVGAKEALYLADACLENTLLSIKEDNSLLMDNHSLSLYGGSCIIDVSSEISLKNISISASKSSYYKNIQASFNMESNLMLVSYR